MFKDGKHELYSTTRTQIVSRSLKQRSYKDHITGYYCVINVVLKLYVMLRHASIDFTTLSPPLKKACPHAGAIGRRN